MINKAGETFAGKPYTPVLRGGRIFQESCFRWGKNRGAGVESMIRMVCADCGMKLAVRDELAGKTILCPGCRSSVQLPMESPARTAEYIRMAIGNS